MVVAVDVNQQMTLLRGLLYQEPSDVAWRALCRLLYAWPEEANPEVALDYCHQLLDHWPDTQRRALGSWWPALNETGYARLWPLVRSLQIWFGDIGDKGVERLASWPLMSHITHLDLSVNGVTDEGAVALATSPFLDRLTCLDLSVNEISDEGCEALVNSPHLPRLAHLSLQKNRISEAGAAAIARSPQLARLNTLSLAGNPFRKGQGSAVLDASPHLSLTAREALYKKV